MPASTAPRVSLDDRTTAGGSWATSSGSPNALCTPRALDALGAPRHRRLAEAILERLAERYLTYPNEDNVLGPTRVFFSTYLESIWLLQLGRGRPARAAPPHARDVAALVSERVLEPAVQLIAATTKGMSNRQVWNNAALGGRRALLGPTGRRARATVRAGSRRSCERGCSPTGAGTRARTTTFRAPRPLVRL